MEEVGPQVSDKSPTDSMVDKLESASKAAPLLVVVLAIIYALGLATAWVIDTQLGVGSISVPRERAISLGIFALVQSIPVITFYLSIRSAVQELSAASWLDRTKEVGLVSIGPTILSFGICWPIYMFLGITSAVGWLAYTLCSIVMPAVLISQSKSNARRAVILLPWFLVAACGGFIYLAPSFPIAFGGHAGPMVKVKFKDNKEIIGELKTSDGTTVVIKDSTTTQAISRDQVAVIVAVNKTQSK